MKVTRKSLRKIVDEAPGSWSAGETVAISTETSSTMTGAAAKERPEPANTLRARSIGTVGVLVLSLAFAGPTVSIFFNSAPAVVSTGSALPLAFVIATIGAIFVANSVIQFAKKLPTSSFAYTFNANGLGPRWGHMSGWLLLLGYALTSAMIAAATALWGSTLVQSLTGAHVSWVWFFLAAMVFVFAFAHYGIHQTAAASVVLVTFEVCVVTALSITILVHHGASGLSAKPFLPSAPGATWTGVFLAMVFTVMSFVGFEDTAVLGEESRNPRRVIPRATLLSVVLLGVYYIFTSYAEVIGFGIHHNGSFAKYAIPFDGLANMYWSHDLSYFIATAAVTALLAGLVASFNATARVLFAMGRSGGLPYVLGRTSRAHQTPLAANITLVIFCLLVGGGVGLFIGPGNVWAYLGSFMVPAIIIVYILVNVSLFRFYRKVYPEEFSWLKHALFPLIGTAAMALPLKAVVWPVPSMPYVLAPYIVAFWIVLGLIWMAILQRRRPEALTSASKLWTDD